MAGIVSSARALDLDNVSTEVGEVLGTPRASQHPAKV
jgi:hypothetical protein